MTPPRGEPLQAPIVGPRRVRLKSFPCSRTNTATPEMAPLESSRRPTNNASEAWSTLLSMRSIVSRGRPCSRRDLSFHGSTRLSMPWICFAFRICLSVSVFFFCSKGPTPYVHRSTIPNSTATGLSTPNICMLIVVILLAFATLLARGRRCTLSFWDLIFFDVITLSIVNQSLQQ